MSSKRSFLLRLPPELWEALKRWADDDLRSVNAQIEYLLREAVQKSRRTLHNSPNSPDSESEPRKSEPRP
jgi:hypothetical protein